MAASRRYLVTGATGQDGSYLVERLIADGHEVHGMCHSDAGVALLAHASARCVAHVADLGDGPALSRLVATVRPTHIVNLAGNTSVAWSWDSPAEAAELLGVGPVRVYEAAWRLCQEGRVDVRMLQASSAEMFGNAKEAPQTESTPLAPVTPYGAAKAFAHQMAGIYRARGLRVSTAILYNHESPRRPETFVTRKITRAVVRISKGLQTQLLLGDLDVERDWGYAPDYVDAMLLILDQSHSSDFIVATGVSHTVRDFVEASFAAVGIADWERYVVSDPALHRPSDPRRMVGDPTKLRAIGWTPRLTFPDLVVAMISAELESADYLTV